MPKSDTVVMVVTVITVVSTHDLSKGVLAGVVLSALFFAAKISKVRIEQEIDNYHDKKIYKVHGQLFFASVTDFVNSFNYKDNMQVVEIDLSNAHVWDDSAVGAIDKVVMKFRQNDKTVKLSGVNQDSTQLIDKLAVYDKPAKKVSGH